MPYPASGVLVRRALVGENKGLQLLAATGKRMCKRMCKRMGERRGKRRPGAHRVKKSRYLVANLP
jgi:hypothetical protein